jgi:hypothetical protein
MIDSVFEEVRAREDRAKRVLSVMKKTVCTKAEREIRMSVARSISVCRKEVLLIDFKTQLGAAWIHQCEESMLRQASRLFIKRTGKMPVPPAIPKAARLLRSARNDILRPRVTERLLTCELRGDDAEFGLWYKKRAP